jgi:hypothetical protein
MRALAILCVVPGFSLGLIAGATHLVGPLEPSAQRTNLVWSNRVFTTRKEFETWLVSRGSNYELWSQRHPVAARHFEDASRSLAANASAEDSTRPAHSGAALLIAIFSFAALLVMIALPRFVRSARFLLEPPKTKLRLRGPPSAIVASARPHGRLHALRVRTSAFSEGAGRFEWRESWSGLSRLARVTAVRAAHAADFNSRAIRRELPRVAFYGVAVILSFAIGAWVAIYL